ncbi:MAG: T9SS type A sorting domain-containing protein [Bacteroidia bacterium]|nr:T9SS type A sorting domain-containing protein [Bacteroidia bacterium]
MKKFLIYIFLFISTTLVAQQKYSHESFLEIVKGEESAHAGKMTPNSLSATQGYDVKHYNCYWNVNPANNYISGYVTTTFVPVETTFDSLILDLTDALTVDSVIYHNLSLSFTHSSDIITIPFTSSLQINIPDSVTVYYHGTPASSGFGSFIQDTHSGTPVIWTLSEPYGSSDWWPCKNGLTDKADSIDIFLNVPNAMTGASNGILIAETPNGTTKLFHWKHKYPIATYLICMAVTNYVKYSHYAPFAGDTLEIVNYVYPEDSLLATSQTDEIVSMVQLYDTLFGVYPFQNEKYGHAQFGWGGGMEHQTMTFVSNFGFDLLAHELAHHWFGDKVTCGSWVDIWLNEGFATYLSGLCFEHLEPYYWMPFKQNEINYITSQSGGSVFCTDTTNISRLFSGRLTYAKGAMILHQLRWVLGDSVFYSAINNYLSDVTCAYEFATTADLKGHFESASGQNLTWYFNDWYTGEGFPTYNISWSQVSNSVYLQVDQVQSHPSVPFFELPIPVKLKNSTQDTIVRLNHTFSGETFLVNIPFTVDSVIFDPEWWIISNYNSISTGINEPEVSLGISIYPNPANDKINIRLNDVPVNASSISVINMVGEIIREIPVAEINESIDISKLASGFYFIKITAGDKVYAEKFMKL